MEVLTIANKSNELPVNERIKFDQVLVIGPNGEQLGIKTRQDALTLASYSGFDLVLISPNAKPPVCKLMDYNKFRYEKQKKQKEASKKQKQGNLVLKEFRLSPVIDKHDFETKLKNVRKYLEKGSKIKISIKFKGRQMAHPEIGEEVMVKFFNGLIDIAEMEQKPKLDGRSMIMTLITKKDK